MSILSTLAAQFAQHELTKYSLVGKRKTAKKAERARIDAHFTKARDGVKTKSTSLTSKQIRSQKATSRRKSIMKRVAPADSGYQRLLKTLSGKKSSKEK